MFPLVEINLRGKSQTITLVTFVCWLNLYGSNSMTARSLSRGAGESPDGIQIGIHDKNI